MNKRNFLKTKILASLLLLSISTAHAAQEQQSFESLLSAANKGDSAAQNKVGVIYYKGKKGADKKSEGVQWFEKSVSQGNVDAMFNLGTIYYSGKGALNEKANGKALIEKAAIGGNAQASYKIGTMYQSGELDSKVNLAQAVHFVRMAAEKGFTEAQNRLGYFYSKGMGVEKDDKIAHEWYVKAANKGFAKAQYNAAQDYYFGTGTEKNEKLAMSLYKKSAAGGNNDAKLMLSGLSHQKGDDKQSYGLLKDAAKGGDLAARAMLSNIHMNEDGKITDNNPDESLNLYSKNAKAGDREAQYQLGRTYLKMGNESEGVKWIELAATQGHPDAIKLTQLNKNYRASNRYIDTLNKQRRGEMEQRYNTREQVRRDLQLYGIGR